MGKVTLADTCQILQLIGDGNASEVASLLRRNPELAEARTEWGQSPLKLAAEIGNSQIVRLLLDAGANPNTSLNVRSRVSHRLDEAVTPAMFAANPEIVETLIAAGANPNARDGNGSSVFYWLALKLDVASVHKLVDLGATPTRSELDGIRKYVREQLEYRTKGQINRDSVEVRALENMVSWLDEYVV